MSYKCPLCEREFEKAQSMGAHKKWCDPKTRPNLSGCKNPMWGRTNRSNQWSKINWDQVEFENLGYRKRRERLLREANYACVICAFSQTRLDGTVILQVDHVDGQPTNNTRNNLRVLCPNCHAVHSTKFMHIGQKHTEETKERIRQSILHNTAVSPRFPKPLKE